jgi:hypothetical protein
MIETVPLEQAADGYARMMQGKARLRMVLVAKEGVASVCRSTEAKESPILEWTPVNLGSVSIRDGAS